MTKDEASVLLGACYDKRREVVCAQDRLREAQNDLHEAEATLKELEDRLCNAASVVPAPPAERPYGLNVGDLVETNYSPKGPVPGPWVLARVTSIARDRSYASGWAIGIHYIVGRFRKTRYVNVDWVRPAPSGAE